MKNILDNELVSLGYDSFQRRSIIDKFINELVKIKKQLLNDVDFFLQSDPAGRVQSAWRRETDLPPFRGESKEAAGGREGRAKKSAA